jgi:DNA repair exonuclease SbcCD ATPase subunit
MKITKWWWKNYKSYGQVPETIELDPNNGKLYLMTAKNGGGKTTAITSTDLALYGEVSNKEGKRLPKENYPNRINGDLEVGIEFENKGNHYYIKRTMDNKQSPLKTVFKENGENISKTGLQKTIEEKIGFDYKTYKSFISMDVNVFKNFMSLTPEEKRILLDKLFNIEQINKLNKLLKQLKKDNDIDYTTIREQINIYEDNINDLLNTIEEYKVNKSLQKEKVIIDNTTKINNLKKQLKSNKTQFENITTQKDDLKELIEEFEEGINKLRLKKNNILRDITDIQDKIDLYKGGKCPTCLTVLTGELNLLPEYEETLVKTNLVLDKLTTKISQANKELLNNKSQLNIINEKYNTIYDESANINAEIKSLTKN